MVVGDAWAPIRGNGAEDVAVVVKSVGAEVEINQCSGVIAPDRSPIVYRAGFARPLYAPDRLINACRLNGNDTVIVEPIILIISVQIDGLVV